MNNEWTGHVSVTLQPLSSPGVHQKIFPLIAETEKKIFFFLEHVSWCRQETILDLYPWCHIGKKQSPPRPETILFTLWFLGRHVTEICPKLPFFFPFLPFMFLEKRAWSCEEFTTFSLFFDGIRVHGGKSQGHVLHVYKVRVFFFFYGWRDVLNEGEKKRNSVSEKACFWFRGISFSDHYSKRVRIIFLKEYGTLRNTADVFKTASCSSLLKKMGRPFIP